MSFWTANTTLTPKGANIYDDGSVIYTRNKKIKLYIFDQNTKRVLVFKPFIDSLSYSFDYKLEDNDSQNEFIDGNQETVDGIQVKISLSINLLASTIDEARLNLSKVNELTRMHKLLKVRPAMGGGSGKKEFTQNTFGVYLSNLISNGTVYNQDLSNHVEAYNNCLFGYINDFKFDLSSKELGFFDVNKKLFPKQIKLSFSLIVNFAANYLFGGKDLLFPFKKDGNYFSDDVETWPFSVPGVGDYSSTYSNNKNAFVAFTNDKCPTRTIKYDLFLDSLNTSILRKGEEITKYGASYYSAIGYKSNNYEFDFSFDVPSGNKAEAEINMIKFQQLLRIVNNFNDKVLNTRQATGLREMDTITGLSTTRIMLSNLINTGTNSTTDPNNVLTDGVPCMVKSFTFEPNLDMGLFDVGGNLFFKSYKLSFKCAAKGKAENPNAALTPRYGYGVALRTTVENGLVVTNTTPTDDFVFIEDISSFTKFGNTPITISPEKEDSEPQAPTEPAQQTLETPAEEETDKSNNEPTENQDSTSTNSDAATGDVPTL
jgi:hypothetical protein